MPKRLHKPKMIPTGTEVREKCTICGATRLSRFTYGWFPWKLYGKPAPYCSGHK